MSEDKLHFVAGGIMNICAIEKRNKILNSIDNIQKFALTLVIPEISSHALNIVLSDKDAKDIQIVCRNVRVDKNGVNHFPGYLVEDRY